jgi:hypothetical protein
LPAKNQITAIKETPINHCLTAINLTLGTDVTSQKPAKSRSTLVNGLRRGSAPLMLTLLPFAAALQEADAATPPPLASQDTSGALVSQSKKPSSQASTVGPASSTGMQTPVVPPVVQQAEMRPASAQATSTQGVIQAASEAPAALTGAAATASTVQDVVVTAPSNTSMAQKATASIDVVGGEQLEQNAVPDITTLIQSMAGVSLKTEGVGQTEIEMRGMTSSGGNSPTTGFYLDNIPLTPPSGAQNGKVVISPCALRHGERRGAARTTGHAIWRRRDGRSSEVDDGGPGPQRTERLDTGDPVRNQGWRVQSHRKLHAQHAADPGRHGIAHRRNGGLYKRLDRPDRRQSLSGRHRQWCHAWGRAGRSRGRELQEFKRGSAI